MKGAVKRVYEQSATAQPWTMYGRQQRWTYLVVLFLVSTSNYFDRHVVSVLLEPIKHEFHVSDARLGLLSGLAFAVFNAIFGLPIARWADRYNRRTILTVALAAWSALTVLCGAAQTFWQLALARVGVGAAESASVPPAQSLIVDYFRPDQRATALSIFTAAGTAGNLLALGLGAYVASALGWRAAFFLAGAPGVLLALVARVTLAEPRLGRENQSLPAETEGLKESLTRLYRKRSFTYGLVGCILCFLLSYGALVFVPSFLIRELHASLRQVGAVYGSVIGVASVVGTLGGGLLADRLGSRDVRWLAWLPSIACITTGVLYVAAFSASSFWIFMMLAFVAYMLLTGGLPPIFAAIHAVCGSRRRATAVAVVLFSATLIGGGFGPLLTGYLSDLFKTSLGIDGLRYSLILLMIPVIIGGIFFYMFGRVMTQDLEQ